MKVLVVGVIALSMPLAVNAASLPIRLKDGATWTITAQHVRDSSGPRAQKWALTTVKRLTWSAPGNGRGARLTVTPLSATPGAESPPEIARARSLAVPAMLEVDESLTPGAVVNVDEVRAAFQIVIGRDVRGSEALADAAAMAMIATEAAWAARGQGGDLELGKTFESDGEIENPIGGPPIQARDSYRLESYDPAAGRAVIVWRQTVDTAAFARTLVESLAARMRSATPPMKPADIREALKDATGTIENTCRHDIDIPTGLAVKVACQTMNRMTVQGETRGATDTWTITQTLPEAL